MSVSYDCGGLLSSFDQCGRDRDLVVAGGQVVMCIVRYDDGVVHRMHHLRLTRKLDHSVAQLAWNHCLHDDVIGMASPSGKLFELKVAPDGQVTRRPFVDPEHQQGVASGLNKRQISRVRFHPTEPLLFSGSHDGQVRGFDLRAESSLITRLPFHKPADNTSLPKCYDFQFERVSGNYIYAVYDNGSVIVWDWRHQQAPYDTCHLAPGQPLFSMDLHPTRKRFAAISSRDQLIHLHSFENRETTLMRVPNVTGRLEWRPNRPEQFATCSVTPDQLIYVWDSRRPYVPFATFDGHHKLVDVQWRRGDEHTLIAADNYEPTADEKHGYLIWHRFRSSDSSHVNSSASLLYSASVTRPSETFRSAVLALSNMGEVISVQSNNRDHLKHQHWPNHPVQTPQTPSIPTTTNYLRPSRFTMSKTFSQPSNQPAELVPGTTGITRPIDVFLNPTSIIQRFTCPEVVASVNTVKTFAREYRLTGAPIAQICAHNAAVAKKCARPDVARAWELIGATMGSVLPAHISVIPGAHRAQSEKSESPDPQIMQSGKSVVGKGDQQANISTPSGMQTVNRGIGRSVSQTAGDQDSGHGGAFCGGTTTDSDCEAGNGFDLDALVGLTMSDAVASVEHILPDEDSQIIIPPELGPSASQYLNRRLVKNLHGGDFTVGSASVLEERRPSLDNKSHVKSAAAVVGSSQSAGLAVGNDSAMLARSGKAAVRLEDYVLSIAPDSEMGIFAIKAFEWSPVIIDLIESFANANDAQNACTMLIVASPLLASGSQNSISPDTQRYWFQEYLALLSRLQLACPLARLLNSAANSASPSLQFLSGVAQEQSLVETTYTPLCHACGDRALTITSGNNTGPICKRCKRMPAICTVCSKPVRGLYAWCRVCFHGGHLVHFRDWFKNRDINSPVIKAKCPSGGCEHACDVVFA